MKAHSILFAALVLPSLFAADAPAASTPTTPVTAPASALATLRAQVERLRDTEALRELAYAYGRGNDALAIRWADREAGKRAGAAEYARAFAPDVRVEVRALGGAEPIGAVDGIPAWVEFVDAFYSGKGYSSTLHPMSNFRIEFTGPASARVSAFAIAPHFLVQAAARGANTRAVTAEWMLCRYQYEARKQADGSWRIAKMDINLEEIMRSEGFYPDGQRRGR